MDEVLARIKKIQCMLNLLETPFEPVDDFEKINAILDHIENQIKEYPLSSEKIDEEKATSDRDELIAKSIFPFYWYINEQISFSHLR